MQPLIAVTRTNQIESIHNGFICVTDPGKNIIYSIGDSNTKVYLRSSAKPIQAVAFVNSGVMDKFNISLEELAIICSSHSGEDFHRGAVRSILSKIGLSEENLSCGVANPYNQDAINELIRKGERPSQLYNCCSGKHAGMLALCRYYSYPVEGYTEPEHPVQQLILKTIADLLECETEDITLGIDGCGIPTFMIKLCQAAYLYSLLAAGSNGTGKYNESFELIKKAMTTYPRMINGNKEFCTDLITHSGGKVIGKVGAEGIYCVAVTEKQLGICIKISDGNERGVYPVTTHILRQLGILDDRAMKELKIWASPPIKNHKGKIVGYTVPIFDIDKKDPTIRIGDKFKFKGEDLWNH
ncbi:asparaginase [Petroclostridium sp. X23]|uniref:asparaginase n=1 Tax=Petroclostridium sp. X23 TaxID=3045146 RepID=UPI0024AD07CD|nr:asparaginase [Petroclostridium sp. X23]WHH60055.1 asparaginase [Petroclostridium sp. X23]